MSRDSKAHDPRTPRLPVSLHAVVQAMDVAVFDDFRETAFIVRRSGELWTIGPELAALEDPEAGSFEDPVLGLELGPEELDSSRKRWEEGDWVALPEPEEIDEPRVMEAFVADQASDAAARLARTLHRRGMYRMFKDECASLRLIDAYYLFRDRVRAELARGVLESHEIPFVDDLDGPR